MLQLAPLNRIYFGNPLSAWLTAAGVALGVWLLLYLIKRVIGRRITILAARTATEVDDLAAELLSRTRFYLLLALAIRAGSVVLALTDDTQDAIRKLTAIAVLLQLAVWGNAIISFWLRRWSRMRNGDAAGPAAPSTTINAIGLMARGALWSIVVLLALRNVLDYDITALVTGLGIGGIAIALAIQNVLGDLFAALSIVLDKPFDVGDTIAVDNLSGTVEHIGLKTTRVRAVGGEQVIFSNADLLKSRVRNLKRMTDRRVEFLIGVTYDTPPEQVERIPALLQRIVEAQPGVRFDRAHFARFRDSSLEFEVVYFVTDSDYLRYMNTQQAINLALLRQFGEAKIEFAFPTQTVIQRDAASRDGAEHPSTAPAASGPAR